ncbi:MAG: flippase-like domain-containing protein [Catenulisporales bacterium]|nr:flippase-like domain-containing protein [Catenulisporales bacterium]
MPADPPPAPPRRVRLPADRLRLAAAIALAVLLAAVGIVGHRAGCDLRPEIAHRAAAVPRFLLNVVQVLAFLSVIGVPVGVAVERLVKRETEQVVDAVGTVTLAYGAAFGINVLTSHYAGSTPAQALGGATPMQAQLAVGVAAVSMLGFSHSRLRTLFLSAAALGGLAVVLLGRDSVTGVLLSALLGRIVATGWMSVRGVIDTRPGIGRILDELRRDGLRAHPGSVRVLDAGADSTRRYRVTAESAESAESTESTSQPHKTTLDLSVLDRAQRAAELPSRLWQWIRLRGPAHRRGFLSLRRSVESEVLMAMAVAAAGVRTPALRSARQVDQDTALLAYDHIAAPRLADLPDRAFTDRLHHDVWALWRRLRARQLAHRELTLDHLLLDQAGRLWLTDVGYGEITAEDVLCRLDGAELLVCLALRVGPDRATEQAAAVLGPDTVASLLPLMQPILFSEETAGALKRERAYDLTGTAKGGDIVGAIRDRITALHPEADVQPISLERVRPRTVLSVVGGTIAFYLLATQLTGFQAPELGSWQAWGWVTGAAVASALTYVSAAFNLVGCVKEHLPFRTAVTAQIAAAFAGLVAPGAVGGMAVNTRYLQRAGIPVARAVTSVGVSQLVAFTCYLLLLLLFSAFAGNRKTEGGGLSVISPSATVTGVIVGLAVLCVLIAATPRLRTMVLNRLRPLFTDVWPEVLQVARSPRKLVQAVGGAFALPLAASVSLWASVNAVSGNDVSLAAMGVAYLVAKALGSLVPTPGGIGGIEAALTAGLTTAGVPSAVAATSVIVFRLLTWWLPVIPGWFAFTALQRRGAL